MQIACVLKSGPEYRPEHVRALAESIRFYNDVPIVCLSDIEFSVPGVQVRKLQHGWPGWWSKLELFREFTGKTLYLDLDTVVVGELPPVGKLFTMLPDVYRAGDVGSGVMSWDGDYRHIYSAFLKSPGQFMQRYRTRRNWGDQAFIRDYLGMRPALFGAEYRSYKVHCQPAVPAGTRVVYFHGKPKPWEVTLCLT